MSEDYIHYGNTPPHVKASATSRAAAQAIEPRTPSLRLQVLEFILSCGEQGATDQEIAAALNLSGDTQRPRRCELVKQGKIRPAFKMRKTSAGRDAQVWIAT